MKSIYSNLSALIRPVRVVIIIAACAFLLFAQSPAYSATNTSHPTKGEDKMMGIEKESQRIIQYGEPVPGPESTKARTSGGGLNAVQGKADAESMYRSENSGTETVEKDLGNAINDLAN